VTPLSYVGPEIENFRLAIFNCGKGTTQMAVDGFDLTGRVALVTGGSKGLGKAMARGLARAGADIVISSRHEDELKAALDEIAKSTGVRGKYVVADMSRRSEASRLAKATLELMGRVDILINNAGSNKPQPIDEIRDEDWDTIVELNLSSVMALTRSVVPQMKARRWGRIVHISSIMGFISKEGRDVYSATKSALIGMARASALELGAFGITVNCLAPGPFLTDLPGSLLSDEEKHEFAKRTAIGRWGDPQELVGPALLLVSDAGSYITGQTLVVDGGYLAR
jgi:NAD(P)-dependent dehydrogenase (short-subunit alcohol dehydrogenase family)